MSYYTELESKDELIEEIKRLEEPFCASINYSSEGCNYKFWSGNQHYESYEKWIEEEEEKRRGAFNKLEKVKIEISKLLVDVVESGGIIDQGKLTKLYRMCE